jgi:hypothetical protein
MMESVENRKMGMKKTVLALSLAIVPFVRPCVGQPAGTDPPALRPNYFTWSIHEKAVEAGDHEGMAAAEYNLLHLAAAGTNDTEASAALVKLATLGDEFTLAWLKKHSPRTTNRERRTLLRKTQGQIRHRLQIAPSAPEKLVWPRLLRMAVADLTCNDLEVEIKGFTFSWVRLQATKEAVRAELHRLDQPASTAAPFQSSASIHQRASSYADHLLKLPNRSSK